MNEQALERMIGDLDRRIAIQLAEIQNHPALRELERVWRTLWHLVEELEPDERTQLALFHCPIDDIRALGSPAPLHPTVDAVRDSPIYPLIRALRAEDRNGLEPTAVVIADYQIGTAAHDVDVATHLSRVGMLLTAPIILTTTESNAAAAASFSDLRRKATASFLCLTGLHDGTSLLKRIAQSYHHYGWGIAVDEGSETRTRMLSDAPATPRGGRGATEAYYAGLLSSRLAAAQFIHNLRIVLLATLDDDATPVERNNTLREAAWSYLRRYSIKDAYTKPLDGFPEEVLTHVNVDVDAEALRITILLTFNFADPLFSSDSGHILPTVATPLLLLTE